jgi:hypothetical protein
MSLFGLTYLRNLFTNSTKTDLEEYILSKNPKTAADVEHWLQQYTYNTKNWMSNV